MVGAAIGNIQGAAQEYIQLNYWSKCDIMVLAQTGSSPFQGTALSAYFEVTKGTQLMKKLISILLVGLLICSLTACSLLENLLPEDSSSQFESKIIGKWEFQNVGIALEFNEGHIGQMVSLEDPSQYAIIRWSYDADADVYLIYVQDKAYVYYASLDYEGNLTYAGETGAKVE